jgi:hypothetical protein
VQVPPTLTPQGTSQPWAVVPMKQAFKTSVGSSFPHRQEQHAKFSQMWEERDARDARDEGTEGARATHRAWATSVLTRHS